MLRVEVDIDHPPTFEPVAHALRAGGVVVMPTDTIYGFSARFDRPGALRRIGASKARHGDEPFLVLIASIHQLALLAESPPARAACDLIWPGKVTALLPARPGLPSVLVGPRGTVAVRYPKPRWLRRIIELAEAPIISTSVNRRGEQPLHEPDAIASRYGSVIDVMVDMGTVDAVASTVVDCTQKPPVLIREGSAPIDLERLGRALDDAAASPW